MSTALPLFPLRPTATIIRRCRPLTIPLLSAPLRPPSPGGPVARQCPHRAPVRSIIVGFTPAVTMMRRPSAPLADCGSLVIAFVSSASPILWSFIRRRRRPRCAFSRRIQTRQTPALGQRRGSALAPRLFVWRRCSASRSRPAPSFTLKSKRRRDVVFDDALRRKTTDTAVRLHALLASGVTPPPIVHPKCKQCSVNALCLPDLVAAPARYRRAAGELFAAPPNP